MTANQRRVERTARAMDRAEERYSREHPNTVDLWRLSKFRARWHLRHGGRAPGETCGNCVPSCRCIGCRRNPGNTDNWRPKRGGK